MYTPAKITKKIGKERIEFYFGIGAFQMFCDQRKIELEKIQDEFMSDQMGSLADILNAAANFSLLVAGEQEKYNRYIAFTWIDQMTETDLEDIMTTLAKVQILGQGVSGNQISPTASRGRKK